jgi:hypothetical protein
MVFLFHQTYLCQTLRHRRLEPEECSTADGVFALITFCTSLWLIVGTAVQLPIILLKIFCQNAKDLIE